MSLCKLRVLFFLTTFNFLPLSYSKNFSISAEPGILWTGYNYFQIPGTSAGSRLDLPKAKALPVYRIYASYFFSENWSLRFLVAPLTAKYKLTPRSPILFDGETFEAAEPLSVSYKFNSYRISGIRKWGKENETQFSLGFTLKVRDAHIGLTNSLRSKRYSNVGFVPLLYLGVWTPLTEKWSLSADIDGLAGGPGRAFDGRAQTQYKIAEQHTLSLGYRFIEGGVDNEKVNNFALFHFLYAGYSVVF